jgi:tetratricopeptide (TPR) repeat protein
MTLMFAASLVLMPLLVQEAHGTSPSGEAKAQAQVLLRRGTQHYRHAEITDALADFTAAYRIYPSPKLLFNIGQCSRDLGRPVEAIEAFDQFLAEAHDAPDGLVAEARRSVEELSTEVGKLLIECSVSGAEIKLDGKKIGAAPIKSLVRVTPGYHQLMAVREGTPLVMRDTYVLAGTLEVVALRPRAPADGARRSSGGIGKPPLIASSRQSGRNARADRGWLLGRTWTWVATGSAVVFAGGATAAALTMQSKFNALDASCGRSSGETYTGCKSSDFGALDTWKNTANVLWGLSAAAALTAGILFYVEGRGVEVSPTAGQVIGMTASMRY